MGHFLKLNLITKCRYIIVYIPTNYRGMDGVVSWAGKDSASLEIIFTKI